MRVVPALFIVAVVLLGCEEMEQNAKGEKLPQADLYVATNGNDSWSGELAAPNADGTDGPFATLQKARDEIRKISPKTKDITVLVRTGTYYLPEALTFRPEDSGNAHCTIAYLAYPGETVVLSGGRPIKGWQKGEGRLYVADVPEAKDGKWPFKQLFVDGERQIRARYPNFDPSDPIKKGWRFIREETGHVGEFKRGVGAIHTPGDWLQYRLSIPADGEYKLWVYYGANNKPYGRDNMDGRTTMTVDAGAPVPLMNLPNTGGWVDDPIPVSESDGNLYWHGGKPLLIPLPKVEPEKSWEAWQKLGFEKNSIVAEPMFVDPARDNYQLKPDSPAFKLGFKPIPAEKVGILPE